MRNNIKRMLPYIIFNGIVFSIIGAIIGKNLVEIHNTRTRIDNDSRALKRFIKELGGRATHIKIEDIDETDVPEDIRKKADDPKKPIEPTHIYIYD